MYFWCTGLRVMMPITIGNGMFGHDNRGFDKFVSFLPMSDLVVSYGGDYLTVSPTSRSKKRDLTHLRLTVVS